MSACVSFNCGELYSFEVEQSTYELRAGADGIVCVFVCVRLCCAMQAERCKEDLSAFFAFWKCLSNKSDRALACVCVSGQPFQTKRHICACTLLVLKILFTFLRINHFSEREMLCYQMNRFFFSISKRRKCLFGTNLLRILCAPIKHSPIW